MAKPQHRNDQNADDKRIVQRNVAGNNVTPEGADAQERLRADDDAVRNAVTSKPTGVGQNSALPGPPIPPEVQKQIRNKSQKR